MKTPAGPYNNTHPPTGENASNKDNAATMAEDYYKTLGVPRNASQADIQKAYRELRASTTPI